MLRPIIAPLRGLLQLFQRELELRGRELVASERALEHVLVVVRRREELARNQMLWLRVENARAERPRPFVRAEALLREVELLVDLSRALMRLGHEQL